jgi:hypothetical protein
MQNRYVGDISDFVKLGVLRALSPGYRLGVAWWLHPDETHNRDGRHIVYLRHPDWWWHFDAQLFDALEAIVTSGQQNVRALETANILPGAIFASDLIPVWGPIQDRLHRRRQWFERVQHILAEADLIFLDPDNGLEPVSHQQRSSKFGKRVLLTELRELATPERCVIVHHHQIRRKGGHFVEMERDADRLRQSGFGTVDALRFSSRSPRVFFLLDAPAAIRQRAQQIEAKWHRLITWHPDRVMAGRGHVGPASSVATASTRPGIVMRSLPVLKTQRKSKRTKGSTTEVGYINRNHQEVVRPTGNFSTNHEQLVYVLRCRKCGHQYGSNGCDIFQRHCPAHDGGAPGPAI